MALSQEQRRAKRQGYQLKLPRRRRCEICGHYFRVLVRTSRHRFGRLERYYTARTNAKTCSKGCRAKATRKNNRRNLRELRKRWRATGKMYQIKLRHSHALTDGYGNKYSMKRCWQCRKLKLMRITAAYCSRKCRDLAHTTSPPDRPRGKRWYGHVRLSCQICSKPFWGKPTKSRFCSSHCTGEARRLHKSKEQIKADRTMYRRRYYADPVKRARKNLRERGYRQRNKADPIRHARTLALARARMFKVRRDPIKRAKIKALQQKLELKWLTNPQGEVQWLKRNLADLKRLRRFLRNPRAAFPSPNPASAMLSNSQP